jgi:hypothetical protein
MFSLFLDLCHRCGLVFIENLKESSKIMIFAVLHQPKSRALQPPKKLKKIDLQGNLIKAQIQSYLLAMNVFIAALHYYHLQFQIQ